MYPILLRVEGEELTVYPALWYSGQVPKFALPGSGIPLADYGLISNLGGNSWGWHDPVYVDHVAGEWEPGHFRGVDGPGCQDLPPLVAACMWEERAGMDPDLDLPERAVLRRLADSARVATR